MKPHYLHINRHGFFTRFIALLLLLCFCGQEVVRAGELRPAPSAISVPALKVPENLGKTDEHVSGRSDKTVIYIQDAHDSIEAQRHIAEMVSHFVEKENVKTVFEEGYEGPVPTDSFFDFISEPSVKEKVSYFLLDKLRIGGAEFAHINRKKDFKLVGADNIKLHLENIQKYRSFSKHRRQTEEDLAQLAREIEILANQSFPKPLKEWARLRERFEAGHLELLDYLQRTVSMLQKKTPREWPLIDLLLHAAKTKDFPLSEELKDLNAQVLFEEINVLEERTAAQWLSDPADREIFRYKKEIRLLQRLSAIQLTSSEYEAVKKTLAEIHTQKIAEFIARRAKKPVILSKRWEIALRDAVDFYEIAHRRNETIARSLETFLRNPDEKTAVLVYGGFHREAIRNLLKEKAVSFYVVTPKMTGADREHQEFYKHLMSRGNYAFEVPHFVKTAARAEAIFEMGLAPTDLLRRTLAEKIVRYPDLPMPLLIKRVTEDLETSTPAMRAEIRDEKFEIWADRLEALLRKTSEQKAPEYWDIMRSIGSQTPAIAPTIQNLTRYLDLKQGLKPADEYKGIKLAGSGTPDAEYALRSLALYLLERNHEILFSPEEEKRLLELLELYNNHPLTLVQHSIPSLFIVSLKSYFRSSEQFIELSNRIRKLPDDYAARTVALSLFLHGVHLNGLGDDKDDDFWVIHENLRFAAKKLKDPGLSPEIKRMLLQGILRVSIFLVPFFAGIFDSTIQMHPDIAVDENLAKNMENWIYINKKELRKIFWKFYSKDSKYDTALAGLAITLYKNGDFGLDRYLAVETGKKYPPADVFYMGNPDNEPFEVRYPEAVRALKKTLVTNDKDENVFGAFYLRYRAAGHIKNFLTALDLVTENWKLEGRPEIRMKVAPDISKWFSGNEVRYDNEEERLVEQAPVSRPRYLFTRREESIIEKNRSLLEKASRGVPPRPGDIRPGGVFQQAPLWRVLRAFKQAGIQPGQTVADLGHGDGVTLLNLARIFNVRGTGAEWNSLLYRRSEAGRALLEKQILLHPGQVRFRQGDFNTLDLSKADHVFYYSSGAEDGHIDFNAIIRGMKPGAKFILLGVESENDEGKRERVNYYQDFMPLLESKLFTLQRYPAIGAWIFTKEKNAPRAEIRASENGPQIYIELPAVPGGDEGFSHDEIKRAIRDFLTRRNFRNTKRILKKISGTARQFEDIKTIAAVRFQRGVFLQIFIGVMEFKDESMEAFIMTVPARPETIKAALNDYHGLKTLHNIAPQHVVRPLTAGVGYIGDQDYGDFVLSTQDLHITVQEYLGDYVELALLEHFRPAVYLNGYNRHDEPVGRVAMTDVPENQQLIMAQIARIYTELAAVDPEKGTADFLNDIRIGAGDFMIRPFSDGHFDLKLITARSMAHDRPLSEMWDHLFSRRFIFRGTRGLIEGLAQGLVEKYGYARGKKYFEEWLSAYEKTLSSRISKKIIETDPSLLAQLERRVIPYDLRWLVRYRKGKKYSPEDIRPDELESVRIFMINGKKTEALVRFLLRKQRALQIKVRDDLRRALAGNFDDLIKPPGILKLRGQVQDLPAYRAEIRRTDDEIKAELKEKLKELSVLMRDALSKIPREGIETVEEYVDAEGTPIVAPDPSRGPISFEVVETVKRSLEESTELFDELVIQAPARDAAVQMFSVMLTRAHNQMERLDAYQSGRREIRSAEVEKANANASPYQAEMLRVMADFEAALTPAEKKITRISDFLKRFREYYLKAAVRDPRTGENMTAKDKAPVFKAAEDFLKKQLEGKGYVEEITEPLTPALIYEGVKALERKRLVEKESFIKQNRDPRPRPTSLGKIRFLLPSDYTRKVPVMEIRIGRPAWIVVLRDSKNRNNYLVVQRVDNQLWHGHSSDPALQPITDLKKILSSDSFKKFDQQIKHETRTIHDFTKKNIGFAGLQIYLGSPEGYRIFAVRKKGKSYRRDLEALTLLEGERTENTREMMTLQRYGKEDAFIIEGLNWKYKDEPGEAARPLVITKGSVEGNDRLSINLNSVMYQLRNGEIAQQLAELNAELVFDGFNPDVISAPEFHTPQSGNRRIGFYQVVKVEDEANPFRVIYDGTRIGPNDWLHVRSELRMPDKQEMTSKEEQELRSVSAAGLYDLIGVLDGAMEKNHPEYDFSLLREWLPAFLIGPTTAVILVVASALQAVTYKRRTVSKIKRYRSRLLDERPAEQIRVRREIIRFLLEMIKPSQNKVLRSAAYEILELLSKQIPDLRPEVQMASRDFLAEELRPAEPDVTLLREVFRLDAELRNPHSLENYLRQIYENARRRERYQYFNDPDYAGFRAAVMQYSNQRHQVIRLGVLAEQYGINFYQPEGLKRVNGVLKRYGFTDGPYLQEDPAGPFYYRPRQRSEVRIQKKGAPDYEGFETVVKKIKERNAPLYLGHLAREYGIPLSTSKVYEILARNGFVDGPFNSEIGGPVYQQERSEIRTKKIDVVKAAITPLKQEFEHLLAEKPWHFFSASFRAHHLENEMDGIFGGMPAVFLFEMEHAATPHDYELIKAAYERWILILKVLKLLQEKKLNPSGKHEEEISGHSGKMLYYNFTLDGVLYTLRIKGQTAREHHHQLGYAVDIYKNGYLLDGVRFDWNRRPKEHRQFITFDFPFAYREMGFPKVDLHSAEIKTFHGEEDFIAFIHEMMAKSHYEVRSEIRSFEVSPEELYEAWTRGNEGLREVIRSITIEEYDDDSFAGDLVFSRPLEIGGKSIAKSGFIIRKDDDRVIGNMISRGIPGSPKLGRKLLENMMLWAGEKGFREIYLPISDNGRAFLTPQLFDSLKQLKIISDYKIKELDSFVGDVAHITLPHIAMPELPEDLQVYQINARAYFKEKKIENFEAFSNRRLRGLANAGFNTIWLTGIWAESAASRRLNEYWGAREGEPRVASAYSVPGYEINPALGNEEQLRDFVRRANRLGIRVVLDFIPNHFSMDSPLIDRHPDWFVHRKTLPPGGEADLRYFKHELSGGRGTIWVAHGRDSYYPERLPWTDTAQLNFLNPEVWDYLEKELNRVSSLNYGNGLRFDALDAVRFKYYSKIWKSDLQEMGYVNTKSYRSLKPALAGLKNRFPGFISLGESLLASDRQYWRSQGFDAVYEKKFYRLLFPRDNGAAKWEEIKDFALNQEDSEILPLLFLENHDLSVRALELVRRQLGKVSADDRDVRALAGLYASLVATLRGIPLIYQGQDEGKALQGPDAIRLRRSNEKEKPLVRQMYRKLFSITRREAFRRGKAPRLIPFADESSETASVLAFKRESRKETGIVVMNYSAETVSFTLDYRRAWLGQENPIITLGPWESRVQVVASKNPRKVLREFSSRSNPDLSRQEKKLVQESRLTGMNRAGTKAEEIKPVWLFGEQETHLPFIADMLGVETQSAIDPEIYRDKKVLVVPGYGNLPFFLSALGAREVTGMDADPVTIAWQKLKMKTGTEIYRHILSVDELSKGMVRGFYREQWFNRLNARTVPDEIYNLSFQTGDILRPIAYEGEKYDLIAVPYLFGFTHGLETETEWDLALENMKNVLNPGGRILLLPGLFDPSVLRSDTDKTVLNNYQRWLRGLAEKGWGVQHSEAYPFYHLATWQQVPAAYALLTPRAEIRETLNEPLRSELRKSAVRENAPSRESGPKDADKMIFENKRIFIDFRDIQSEAQIKEIVYTAQQPHRNVQVLVHHWDPNAEFGKLFESLRSEKLIVKSGSAEEMARRYARGFKGDIVVLAGRQALAGAEHLKRQIEEASGVKQIFMLGYNPEDGGVLGVGLRDLENGSLRREVNGTRLVKPAYMELKNEILRITNPSEAGIGLWQQTYDRALAFARAA